MIDLTSGCLIAGLALFTCKRLLRYLHYFQQEEYDSRRFLKWIWENKAFDRKGSLTLLLLFFAFNFFSNSLFFCLMGTLSLIWISIREEDPRVSGKLRLIMTERAKRLYRTALALSLFSFLSLLFLAATLAQLCLYSIIALQAAPFYLMISALLLMPGENRRQRKFLQEAQQILKKVNPYVIGITGSYGKTSTKHLLSHILQVTRGPTFWPAKGINTPMGITREIRTALKPGTQFAVIEMGAYGIGSIQSLCNLTPPHAAIITHIGTAHLERFKSREAIYQAKSELARSIPLDGILVCNGDNPGARQIAIDFRKKTTLLYGFDNSNKDLDCWISLFETTPKGTAFTLEWKGQFYHGLTPQFGKPALLNVAGSFAMACTLGSHPEYVLAAIRNIEAVDNRLQVKNEGNVTYLHDAYNSNPTGFDAALQVLASLKAKRRILMTPGMIELGVQQREENQKIGLKASQICDWALIVGDTNKMPLLHGLESGIMKKEHILFCETRNEAFEKLKTLVEEGDAVLIENDLVDLYETPKRF